MQRSPPYVDQRGEARYFIAAPDGARYRVYDVRFVNHVLKVCRITSRAATARIFRPAEGPWRIYHFVDAGDRHHLAVFTLQSQLATSIEYTPPPATKAMRRS